MKVFAIRGAITIDSDCVSEIKEKSEALAKAIVEKNTFDSIVSIIVSTTEDIRSLYPAKIIRESGLLNAPIFSCKEPEINGALPLCIRLLVTVVSNDNNVEAHHAYLGKARELRRDISE